jgi:hypothetical protein
VRIDINSLLFILPVRHHQQVTAKQASCSTHSKQVSLHGYPAL